MFLKLELKSFFEKGIKRDLIKLNLFLYRFNFLWHYYYFNYICKKKSLKLTLLRSVFINKTSRLQYSLQNYSCTYNFFFINNWLLLYFFFILKKGNFIVYSNIFLTKKWISIS